MTIKTTLIAAGALVAASFAAIPAANAGNLTVQFGYGGGNGYSHSGGGYGNYDRGSGDYDRAHRRFVSERHIHRILRRNGYRSSDISRRGPFYVAKAYDYRGAAYRIRLSAFDGDILAVRRLDRRHRWN